MRTNIVIDDKLMEETLRATGLKTKREAVELGAAHLAPLAEAGRDSKVSRQARMAG
jgi:Arc/MetJ family transcription regulator